MKQIIFLMAILLLPLFSASGGEGEAKWIWHNEKEQDQTTRFFRFALDVKPGVKSAELLAAADDRADFRLNGEWLKPAFSLRATKFDLSGKLKPGKNTLEFKVFNAKWKAGLVVRGEILYTNGEIQKFRTGDEWTSSTEENGPHAPVKVLGGYHLSPWNTLMDVSPFRDPGASRFSAIAPEKRGRLMLDDFSDVSSWMGGPVRGQRPGHNVLPFQLGFGAGPDLSRADGGTGMIDWEFVEKNGELVFEKNSVYQNSGFPEAIEFDANPQGAECDVSFELMDRRNRPVFRTDAVRLAGNGWKRYRLELNRDTVRGYDDLVFPISIRRLRFQSPEPGKGRVLLDDLAFVVDIDKHPGQTEIRPVYTKLHHLPGEAVTLSFRIRNGRNETVSQKLKLEIRDAAGKPLLERQSTVTVAPFGQETVSFDIGSFDQKGPYRILLSADNGHSRREFAGWFGVFEPNGGRVNRKPMWFGVEDQEIRNFQYEMLLHLDWMKLLGADLARGGLIGAQAGNLRGSNFGYEQYAEMWKPYQDAGIQLLVEYAGSVPGWTGKRLAEDPEAFREHITDVSRFLAALPGARYFEWFNEPNLGFFNGTTDEYLNSQRLLYPVMKRIVPEVKIASGGVVIEHASAKPDFSRRMFQENADYWDIANFHGHENYLAYIRNTDKLQSWLDEAGVKKPIGNSEAGFRSYYGAADLYLIQAVELVQKISFTKSRGGEYHVWFMLHDYGDKYINADDSFGLVTVENQPKPSFLAYNELIRQLADTDPAEKTDFDTRLTTLRFDSDREEVYVNWPSGSEKEFSFAVRSAGPLERIDLFGNRKTLRPSGGIVYIDSAPLPFYLRAAKGTIAPVGLPLAAVGNTVFVPGEKGELELKLSNPYNIAVSYRFRAAEVERRGELAPGKSVAIRVPVAIPANATETWNLEARLVFRPAKGDALFDGTVNIPCRIALPIGDKVPGRITLDRASQVRELMFDPNTPVWSGPEDLSADFRLRSDGKKLFLEADVRDADHSVPREGIHIWQNDNLQIATADADGNRHYEFTVSGDAKNAPTVWCHIAPDESKLGRWEIPATVMRDGKVTRYRVEVPLEQLELNPQFRLALLVTDNDGGRMLRNLIWNDGIQPTKNTRLFGWAKLVK